jgi:hypothetical protein
MSPPGKGKESGVAKPYKDVHKGERQVRDLKRNIPALAKKILTGDYTKMKLYGENPHHSVVSL